MPTISRCLGNTDYDLLWLWCWNMDKSCTVSCVKLGKASLKCYQFQNVFLDIMHECKVVWAPPLCGNFVPCLKPYVLWMLLAIPALERRGFLFSPSHSDPLLSSQPVTQLVLSWGKPCSWPTMYNARVKKAWRFTSTPPYTTYWRDA